MRIMRCLSLLFLLVGGVHSSTLYQWIVDSQTRFNYDPNPSNMLGVYNWPRTYSEDCGGLHQSPVDIQTDLVRYGVSCQCPRMIYSSNILRGKFKNNGHSAEFEPENELMLQLTNVPYRSGMYKLHDFHLHYGGVTGRDFELQGLRFRGSGIMSAGSEHTIDGLRFEGELHFVFYNSKYKDLEEADNKTDGVVVICIMIQKLQGVMSDSTETSRFSEFLEMNIPKIFPYQQNASTEVDLSIFFSRDCEFYTYPGSTTTPTCHESVRWIILKDPIMVTERAWFMLTGLQSRGDFNSRFGNYRTTQPLNDRVIEANFDRPNGVVLPSPNGEAVMMMMMDMMNMTMEMMNSGSNNPMMNAPDIPMMLMERTATSPVGNIRDIPLMMMSMMQNANVPNRDGNIRSMPQMTSMPQQNANVPNLNGNVRRMPMMMMMPMQNDGNVPNLNGNVRGIPTKMMPMQKDGNVPNMNGNIQEMPMMMMPMQTGGKGVNPKANDFPMPMVMMPMQKDANPPNMNIEQMQLMMSRLNSQNIPNLIETAPNVPAMMSLPTDIMMLMMPQDMSVMNAPGIGLPMVRQQVNENVPNLNGNVRGRTMMPMQTGPIFDQNVLRMMPGDFGRGRAAGNVRMQRPSNQIRPTSSGQTSRGRSPNGNSRMNDEDNSNRNNNNSSNRNNNKNANNSNRKNVMNIGGQSQMMLNNMQNLKPFMWNLWA